jgi:serine/threonine protein phosphatase PrpC
MLEAYGISDTGCARTNNEDFYLLVPSLGLYIVADGMGGARAGELASKLAAETVLEYVERSGDTGSEALMRAFETANRAVIRAAGESKNLQGMGTTLVAALESETGVILASVGDSRAYHFDGSLLTPITVDQTWVQEVGRVLGIDEGSLRNHPMRHVLTMAIGVTEDLRIHTYAIQMQPGDQLLLSSDGLHGVVDSEGIAKVLSSDGSLEERCRLLVMAAREKGGPDNITAVLIQAV